MLCETNNRHGFTKHLSNDLSSLNLRDTRGLAGLPPSRFRSEPDTARVRPALRPRPESRKRTRQKMSQNFSLSLSKLNQHFDDLIKSSKKEQTSAVRRLKYSIEVEFRETLSGTRKRLRTAISDAINRLIESPSNENHQIAILVINELFMSSEQNFLLDPERYINKLSRLIPSTSAEIVENAAKAITSIIAKRPQGLAHAADKCFEKATALITVRKSPPASQVSGIILMKHLSMAAPESLFKVAGSFLGVFWVPLVSAKESVAEAAAAAFPVCINALDTLGKAPEEMKPVLRGLYDEAWQGMHSSSVKSIRAGVLVLSNMLCGTQRMDDSARPVDPSLLPITPPHYVSVSPVSAFMRKRYTGFCKELLALTASKQSSVRFAIVKVLPRVASFNPPLFSRRFLQPAIDFLIDVGSSADPDARALEAVGWLVHVFPEDEISMFIPRIIGLVQKAQAEPQGKKDTPVSPSKILTCVRLLIASAPKTMKDHMGALFDSMFAGGLSEPLVKAMEELVKQLKTLLPFVQIRMLNAISFTLSGFPLIFNNRASIPAIFMKGAVAAQSKDESPNPDEMSSVQSFHNGGQDEDGAQAPTPLVLPILKANIASDYTRTFSHSQVLFDTTSTTDLHTMLPPEVEATPGQQLIALNTLSTFNFEGFQLVDFCADVVTCFLNSPNSRVRHAAVKALTKLSIPKTQSALAFGGHILIMLTDIVTQLIFVAVSDLESPVRLAVLKGLHPSYDAILSQESTMSPLLLLLNDEDFFVRIEAIKLIGRLTVINPAVTMPSIRKILTQLLSELCTPHSVDDRINTARYLSSLIKSCHRYVQPYAKMILRTILRELSVQPIPVSIMLIECIAQLANVDGTEAINAVPFVVHIVLDILKSKGFFHKRHSALSALKNIARETGLGPIIYNSFPELLPAIVTIIRNESDQGLRISAMRLLGVLGAIEPDRVIESDPFCLLPKTIVENLYKEIQIAPHLVHLRELKGSRESPYLVQPNTVHPNKMLEFSCSREEELQQFSHGKERFLPTDQLFYSQTVINALMKILLDKSLQKYHMETVTALVNVFSSPKSYSREQLRQVVPSFIALFENTKLSFNEHLLKEFTKLISNVGDNFSPYLEGFLTACQHIWEREELVALLFPLVNQLAVSLPGSSWQCVQSVVPKLLKLIKQTSFVNGSKFTMNALQSLQVYAPILDDNLNLVIPVVSGVVQSFSAPVSLRIEGIKTLRSFLNCISFSEYSSRVVHTLLRAVCAGTELCTADPTHPSLGKALRRTAMNTLCDVARRLKGNFTFFIPLATNTLEQCKYTHRRYQDTVSCILRGITPSEQFERADTSTNPQRRGSKTSSRSHSRSESPRAIQSRAGRRTKRNEAAPRAPDFPKLMVIWKRPKRESPSEWHRWLLNACCETIAQSPELVLSSCSWLASSYRLLSRELLNAAFLSCFRVVCGTPTGTEFLLCIRKTMEAADIPVEDLQVILNLIEFLEHDTKLAESLSVFPSTLLAELSEKCNAFAKALHYREICYKRDPRSSIEHLIRINKQLGQSEAAHGILLHVQTNFGSDIKLSEQCFEQLNQWDEALRCYDQNTAPGEESVLLGKLRCLSALGKYKEMVALINYALGEPPSEHETPRIASPRSSSDFSLQVSSVASSQIGEHRHSGITSQLAVFGAEAALSMRDRALFFRYWYHLSNASMDGAYYLAVGEILKRNFHRAQKHITTAYEHLDPRLVTLLSESYSRAYQEIVFIHKLEDLEEIIRIKTQTNKRTGPQKNAALRMLSTRRLYAMAPRVDVWKQVFTVRSLIDDLQNDVPIVMDFLSLCMTENRFSISSRKLNELISTSTFLEPRLAIVGGKLTAVGSRVAENSHLPTDMPDWLKHLVSVPFPHDQPMVALSAIKNMWRSSSDLISKFQAFVQLLRLSKGLHNNIKAEGRSSFKLSGTAKGRQHKADDKKNLLARILHKMTLWFGVLNQKNASKGRSQNYVRPLHGLGIPSPQQQEIEPDMESREVISKAAVQTCGFFTETNNDSDLPPRFRFDLSWLQLGTLVAPSYVPVWARRAIALEQKIRYISTVSKGKKKEKQAKFFSDVSEAIYSNFRVIELASPELTIPATLRLLKLWFEYGDNPAVDRSMLKGIERMSFDTWLAVIPQLIARLHITKIRVRMLLNKLLSMVGNEHPHALLYSLSVAARSPDLNRQSNAQALLHNIRSTFPNIVSQVMTVSRELVRIGVLFPEQWIAGMDQAYHYYLKQKDFEMMLLTLAPLHVMLNAADSMLTPAELAFKQAWAEDLAKAYDNLKLYSSKEDMSDLRAAWIIYGSVYQTLSESVKKLRALDMNQVSPILKTMKDLELSIPGGYIAGHPIIRIMEFNPILPVIPSKQRPRQLTLYGSDGERYLYLLKGHEDIRMDERVMQLLGLANVLLSSNPVTARHNLTIIRYAAVPLSAQSGVLSWVPNTRTIHSFVINHRELNSVDKDLELNVIKKMTTKYDDATVAQKLEIIHVVHERCPGNDIQRALWLQSESSESWLERRTAFTRSLAVMSMVGYMLGLGDRHPSNLLMYGPSGKIMHIDFGDCFEVAMHRDKFPELIPFRLTRMLVNAMEVSGVEGNFRSTCEATMQLLRDNSDSFMAMLEAFLYDPLKTWNFDGFEPTRASHESLAPLTRSSALSGSSLADVVSPNSHQAHAVGVLSRILQKLKGTDFRNHPYLTVSQQVHALIEKASSAEVICQCFLGWLPIW
eukprot:gnl/Chilomastix_cuspidata/1912.p1 GENE.gnl/Chilomastix_cuspidata/1912~~gnl/Chilomastix_cuspidata/1912.p1  ORF type:complete len:2721 (-),score=739.59 gnl/Chilomastix_cuspidata/1912:140-8302(-)